ncbi:MAG: hypothetical protein ACLSVD_14055 [Eggerthellaceae bacterium]
MKALVLAETADAARELAAGARSRFDEVVLVCMGTEAVTGVADGDRIPCPGFIVEDAYATVNAVFEASAGAVTRNPRMKALVGRWPRIRPAAITDAFSFDGDAAASLYFGVGERTTARGGAAVLQ